jgi:hypothetical protein
MMRFRYENRLWKLWFKYTTTGKRRETLRLLEIDGTDETFAAGASECSTADRFNKTVGREIALVRCLKKCVTEKGMTNAFWKAAMSCYKNRAVQQPKGVAV